MLIAKQTIEEVLGMNNTFLAILNQCGVSLVSNDTCLFKNEYIFKNSVSRLWLKQVLVH